MTKLMSLSFAKFDIGDTTSENAPESWSFLTKLTKSSRVRAMPETDIGRPTADVAGL
jgi:hypothetical protein